MKISELSKNSVNRKVYVTSPRGGGKMCGRLIGWNHVYAFIQKDSGVTITARLKDLHWNLDHPPKEQKRGNNR